MEITLIEEDFTIFDAIEALSAKVVKPGDLIQITAGIGDFKLEQLDPKIIIGNKRMVGGGEAVATRTIKAPSAPGKYFIPVRLEYTKPDGTKIWRNDTLHYEVVAPCAP